MFRTTNEGPIAIRKARTSIAGIKKPAPFFRSRLFVIIEVYGLIVVYYFYNFRIAFSTVLVNLGDTDIGIFAGNGL